MGSKTKSASRITISPRASGLRISGEVTLPRWLLRVIALGIAHVACTRMLELDGRHIFLKVLEALMAIGL